MQPANLFHLLSRYSILSRSSVRVVARTVSSVGKPLPTYPPDFLHHFFQVSAHTSPYLKGLSYPKCHPSITLYCLALLDFSSRHIHHVPLYYRLIFFYVYFLYYSVCVTLLEYWKHHFFFTTVQGLEQGQHLAC